MTSKEYLGRIYPDKPEWEKSPWAKLLIDRYKIVSTLCKDKAVLDSCCGTGWGTIHFIAPIAKHTVGFDLSSPSMKNLPENCTFLQMDALALSFEGNKFDIILALDSIEHFSSVDGLDYIKGLKSCLGPSSILVGTTPLVPEDSLIPVYLAMNRHHINMYTRQSLESSLSSLFPSVKIFEIFHPVCPFFLFICAPSDTPSFNAAANAITYYMKNTAGILKKGRVKAHLRWAKNMIFRKNIVKFARHIGLSVKSLGGK